MLYLFHIHKYTYIYIKGNSGTDRSKLVYNQAGKTIDTDGSVFIFGKDSDMLKTYLFFLAKISKIPKNIITNKFTQKYILNISMYKFLYLNTNFKK